MIVSLIVAMDEKRGIARDGSIPWHLPGDLKRFKAITMGHHLVVGRKTFESIGKVLPGRITVLVTHQENYLPVDSGSISSQRIQVINRETRSGRSCLAGEAKNTVYIALSVEQALDFARSRGENETFVVGGGQIYAQSVRYAHVLYLTIVHGVFDCDIFFPEINPLEWVELEREAFAADEFNPFSYEFIRYQKNS